MQTWTRYLFMNQSWLWDLIQIIHSNSTEDKLTSIKSSSRKCGLLLIHSMCKRVTRNINSIKITAISWSAIQLYSKSSISKSWQESKRGFKPTNSSSITMNNVARFHQWVKYLPMFQSAYYFYHQSTFYPWMCQLSLLLAFS